MTVGNFGYYDPPVSQDQAKVFAFVFPSAPGGTWTAVAGPTLGTTLTVTAVSATRIEVTVPADSADLIGNPWRLRRNGIDKIGGAIIRARPDIDPGTTDVEVVIPDDVTVTVNIAGDGGGASDASELTVDPGTVPFAEPDTREAELVERLMGLGLPEASAEASAAAAITPLNTAMGVADADDAAAVLSALDGGVGFAAAAGLAASGAATYALAENTATNNLLDVTRWSAANPWTGPYAEVGGNLRANVFTLTENLTDATTSTETRALVWLTPDAANGFWEYLSQPYDADGGEPRDTAENAILLDSEAEDPNDRAPRVFDEGMSADVAEEDRRTFAFGPTLGLWAQIKARTEGGTTTISLMGPAGWVVMRTTEGHPDGFYMSAQPWHIGISPVDDARLRIAWIERDHDDVTVLSFHPEDAVSPTSVPDRVNGDWTASGAATIVTPTDSGFSGDYEDLTNTPDIGGSTSLPIWSPDAGDLLAGTPGSWNVASGLNFIAAPSAAVNDEKFVPGYVHMDPNGTYSAILIAQGGTNGGQVRLIRDGTAVGTQQTLWVSSGTPATTVTLATGLTGTGLCRLSVRTVAAGAGSGLIARLAALHLIRTA